ncbi:MAG: LVIVD repeat-containing protein, partial [Candidatus Acidiferrales bacterium]
TTWGDVPANDVGLAHPRTTMTCFACHSSWTPNCFGCHLQMTANNRQRMLHNEGTLSRNWTTYNFQVLRDDAYMLAIDGTVTGHRVAPARSSCAILVSSQNANREWLYYTQQTISAPGFSGQAFSTYVPHTVRATETKQCTDCHVSSAKDNNAWMAQVLLLGTNFLNYEGRYIYVAEGEKGFSAVAVAEHDDPDAIYGSDFQSVAYPDDYKKFAADGRRLDATYRHAGKTILNVQMRGEYVYAAMGKGGFRVFDIANVDNKGFSERMVTAPVSPLGQRLYVKTKYATDVATPTTLAVDPTRTEFTQNQEQPINLMYGFLYVTDKYEGLIVIGDPNLKGKTPGVSTLLNGNPEDNFLKRAVTFNPGGILNGARRITIAGTFAYILCDKGLVVVDLNNPLMPHVVAEIGAPELSEPRGIAIQFRYAFVVDRDGLKVLDVTRLDKPHVMPGAAVRLIDARNVYVARTYAYVAGGKQGLAIVNVERPEHPAMDQFFTADGAMNDVNDVKLGATAASIFAYVADGKNGVRVVQLIAPEDNPRFEGFSPRPMPKLVATYRTAGPALAISKGIDRDRAVDESGNQIAVFGRRGARPFNLEEMQRMYLRDGKLYTVTDTPPEKPQPMGAIEHAQKWIAGWLRKAGGD